METREVVFAALLVGALAALALFYGWLQLRMLRRLRGSHGLSNDESRWRRGQARRRLVGSALMLAMAGMLAWGALVMGPEVSRLHRQAQPESTTPDPRQFVPLYFGVWIVFLLLLLALILLAAVDIWSTRRFSVREQRKILDARRAMLEHEVGKMRQERNGHT